MDCGECLYFDKDDNDDLLSGGRCQLNPPVFHEGTWIWPRVMNTVVYKANGVEKVRGGDWCGKFVQV